MHTLRRQKPRGGAEHIAKTITRIFGRSSRQVSSLPMQTQKHLSMTLQGGSLVAAHKIQPRPRARRAVQGLEKGARPGMFPLRQGSRRERPPSGGHSLRRLRPDPIPKQIRPREHPALAKPQ